MERHVMVRPLHHGRRSSWWRLAASFGDLFDIYSVDLVDLAVRWRQVWPSSWVTCGRLFLRLSLCWLAVRCKWKIHVSLMSPLLNQSSSLACRRIAIILLLLLLQPERLVIQSRQTAVERRFQTQRKRKEGKKKKKKKSSPLCTPSGDHFQRTFDMGHPLAHPREYIKVIGCFFGRTFSWQKAPHFSAEWRERKKNISERRGEKNQIQ